MHSFLFEPPKSLFSVFHAMCVRKVSHFNVVPVVWVQVAKQWYDYDRCTFGFIRRLKATSKVSFTYARDFDENGIIYWIGTNGKTVTDWVNPASVGLVVVTSSEGKSLPYGKLEDVLSRDAAALNCHTNDDKYVTTKREVKSFISYLRSALHMKENYFSVFLYNYVQYSVVAPKVWCTNSNSFNHPMFILSWKFC